ncbi:Uncharacterised protein [BD1-7 clade bacterium]|uniref:Uncharacterized protein n=1 Tax=BD1-7 clade bacterium TaxID=2029982 RepID=A0A5S9P4X5_9GAMM|nr:Uncharacterised protein [BD1-7 clade bacterium]CAA0098399.1 Uncharacterised protein [BD1-7 clade bacterium]
MRTQNKLQQQLVNINSLSVIERQHLARRLHAEVHEGVIDNADVSRFTQNVFERDRDVNLIQTLCDGDRYIGYVAVGIEAIAMDANAQHFAGRKIALGTLRVMVQPEYRGKWSPSPVLAFTIVKYKCLHPLRVFVLFSAVLSPTAYSLLFRLTDEIYPNYKFETPKLQAEFMRIFAKNEWGQDYSACYPPFTVDLGSSIKNEQERIHSKRFRNPHFNYYVNTGNPEFMHGKALIIVALLPLSQLFVIAKKMLRSRKLSRR